MTLVLMLGLVVAACGDVTSEDSSTTSAAASETTTSAASVPTTTGGVDETTTTAAEMATGGPDCLVGIWELDDQAFVQNFDSIFADAGMPEADVTALDGSFTVDLGADGTLRATRDGWGFRVDTGEGVFILEVTGTETGTWSADDSTFAVETDTSDLDINTSVEIDGEVVQMPSDIQPEFEIPAGVATDSAYTCSSDVLTLTNEGVESTLNRS